MPFYGYLLKAVSRSWCVVLFVIIGGLIYWRMGRKQKPVVKAANDSTATSTSLGADGFLGDHCTIVTY